MKPKLRIGGTNRNSGAVKVFIIIQLLLIFWFGLPHDVNEDRNEGPQPNLGTESKFEEHHGLSLTYINRIPRCMRLHIENTRLEGRAAMAGVTKSIQ